jgi:hypothetical protein
MPGDGLRGRSRRKLSDVEKERIVYLHDTLGAKFSELACRFGVTYPTITSTYKKQKNLLSTHETSSAP